MFNQGHSGFQLCRGGGTSGMRAHLEARQGISGQQRHGPKLVVCDGWAAVWAPDIVWLLALQKRLKM
jgi:hypothetical protein